MKIYTGLRGVDLKHIGIEAQRAEALGFDGVSFGEIAHDVFLEVALALQATERIHVGPAIAIAFARSPMVTAYLSWDLQHISDGRFELGLGSQVKGHNERRFSVPWSPPAPRMREYALALKAIWDCYQNGTRLNFTGRHYTFTLMNHEFNAGPIEYPDIPIYLAAVGSAMSRVAGEVYDGVLPHGFTTQKYQKEATLPQVNIGAARSGRSMEDFMIAGGGFMATGATEDEVYDAREAIRFRVAWYGSTRSYKPVFDAHEWGDTGLELHELSIKQEWDAMPKLITNTMLDTFCVSGTYEHIVPQLKDRYGSYASRISFPMPTEHRFDDRIGAALEELRCI
ncbi:TIGR03617 family F420-dependent LLM class oxidoreductase [Dehalococcoidia bacterium]|nr:TIGR03617 family F420-dependent LLM class oxidoreductase [Dehalococcoidia bacterium]